MPDTVTRGQSQGPASGADAGGKSILIVDGDHGESALLRNCLEACGYEVSCWIDVADARDRLAIKNYDVVVFSTNLGNEGMDVLLADLRPRKVPPKVILIADEDQGDAAARCFLRTVILVNRPFKVSEVADIVEHLIGAP